MSKNRLFTLVIMVIFSLTMVASVSAHQDRYRAHLSGSQEVPPVDTDAQGMARLRVNDAGTVMVYQMNTVHLDNAVAAHIHCGVMGQNGPVGVTLTPPNPMSRGRITAPDAGNACGWSSLGDVIAAIESGGAYINVHTPTVPSGEIRGQIQ